LIVQNQLQSHDRSFLQYPSLNASSDERSDVPNEPVYQTVT
jgi:hypothetical protein